MHERIGAAQRNGRRDVKADAVSHAAAMPLVRAAGGRITGLDGRDSTDDDLERVTSNGILHDELLACLEGL